MTRPTILTLTLVLAPIFGLFVSPQATTAQTVSTFYVESSGGTFEIEGSQQLQGNRVLEYGNIKEAKSVQDVIQIPIGPFDSFTSFVQIRYPSGAADVFSEVTLTATDPEYPEGSVTLFIQLSSKPNESCLTGEFVILGGTGAYEGAWGYGEAEACQGVGAVRTGFIVY